MSVGHSPRPFWLRGAPAPFATAHVLALLAATPLLSSLGAEPQKPVSSNGDELTKPAAALNSNPTDSASLLDLLQSGSTADTPTHDPAHRTYLDLLRSDERFPSAAICAQCHPDHYREWSVSPHAYAMLSPVFNAMHMFSTDQLAGTQGDFCIRCHSPVALQREENPMLSVLLRPPVSTEGVTCVVCHRLESDFGLSNGRATLKEGDVFERISGPTGADNLKRALAGEEFGLVTNDDETGKRVHRDVLKFDTMRASGLCGSCHDVNSPNGLRLESAFTQFKNSLASREGQSCQDCHMGVTPGEVLDNTERYRDGERDLNYAWGPAAKVKASPRDTREGLPTQPRRRTNHMFIGPDYSIVHPGLFPHSLEAREFTYGVRFSETAAREISAYLKSLDVDEPKPEQREEAKQLGLRIAEKAARENALSDWLSFRWEAGWGTPEFEEELSLEQRQQLLAGVGFPWADPAEPDEAKLRRQTARLILIRQFNLLNQAHAERVRLLRRGYQLEAFEFQKNTDSELDFRIKIANPTSGHGTPTGFDAERLVYLQVSVLDARNRVIFRSGDRDPNGDVRDLHSAYVHHHAEKEGDWLRTSDWKNEAGLRLTSQDRFWEPDPFLFSLQTRFLTRNVYGGEREQVLPINHSVDPLPYLRPEPFSTHLVGRPAGARKHVRVIPPLGHRWAEYRLGRAELSGARPYRIQLQFIAQMVPVNLVKTISPAGFDFNLSPREVAKRVAYGHLTTPNGGDDDRRGGAVVLWDRTVEVPQTGTGSIAGFGPTEAQIRDVPVSDYPFPHATDEDLARFEESLHPHSGDGTLEGLKFQPPGVIPWPGGVPPGISLLPPELRKGAARNKPLPTPLAPLPAEHDSVGEPDFTLFPEPGDGAEE